jgi:hypothetical protein
LARQRVSALRLDVKTCESIPRLEPLYVNSLDDRVLGASTQPSKQLSQRQRISLRDDQHRPIRLVAYRPNEPEAYRLPLRRLAKAHALDDAANGCYQSSIHADLLFTGARRGDA